MGRTMIAALIAMGMLSGCTDWREGAETVEACVKRFAPKKGAVDPLTNDPGQWVPSYTYDITKLDAAILKGLIKTEEGDGEPGTAGTAVIIGASGQAARDRFADTPATFAGAILLADDPVLYKVRGKSGLHRDLIRQGCEAQRSGMRLIKWQLAREDALIDGELPSLPMSAAQMREIQKTIDKPLIKDLTP